MPALNRNNPSNQKISISREGSWQHTLATVLPHLVVGAALKEKVEPYYYYDHAQPQEAYALGLKFDVSDQPYSESLLARLNAHFNPDHAMPAGPIFTAKNATADIVIPHAFIPRFFNEICGAVALYADNHYSLVRDFYCVGPEVQDESLDAKYKMALRSKFNELHRAYQASKKMQTLPVYAAHAVNGANVGASLFKKTHPMVSSQHELYQRLNAIVHAYRLSEVGGREMPGFVNKMEDVHQYPRIQETHVNGLLSIIQHGDMFYEISEQFRQHENVDDFKLAYVSPDNLFRCGSAALVGGRGTVEESLARVSDYVPRALPGVQPHKDDPQSVLLSLYQNLQPTGQQVTLGVACGVAYLVGQTIPEYIKFEDAKAYSEFAYERMYLGREIVSQPNYVDAYAEAKRNPHLVEGVHFLDAQGKIRQVSVMGMVGINGSRPAANSIASKVVFDDPLYHDNEGFSHGHFDAGKATNFYKTQWLKAFEKIGQLGGVTFILNPVGCGAYDPSADGSQFTAASARGFAMALSEARVQLNAAQVKLILPIYDMRKVYPHYQEALRSVFGSEPVVTCVGGTEASCHLAIVKKYQETNGGKLNVEHKTLKQILEHALYKDSKARRVLLALNYLKLDPQNGLQLGDCVPAPVAAAYGEIVTANPNRFQVKQAIVEAYKNVRGFLYKSSKARTTNFDIYSASLEDIIEHAMNKDGNTRRALMKLGYVDMLKNSGSLQLTQRVPPAFVGAFNEVSPPVGLRLSSS